MPWSLSKKRKMSCNMTFKALCAAAAAMVLAAAPAMAMAQEDAPASGAELLLIYDQSNRRLDAAEIERFAMIASSLGKSLAFGDARDMRDSLGNYDHVICYRLENIPEETLRAICDYRGELMIFGSALMRRYLEATGRSDLALGGGGFDRGVMAYAFSADAAFEAIVDAEDMIEFQTESDGRGTVSAGGQAYPFISRVAGVLFTPIASLSTELAQAAVMREISDWLWPYQDAAPDYHQYLVLDAVYPFMDAAALLERVDALIGEGVPFVISVMPLYENTSYPAMTQLCQVLRYAQRNGGFIIMRAPIIQAILREQEEVCAALTDGLNGYVAQGVYPLGIEVPMRWAYDDFYLDILRRYRTVFVYDDGAESGFSLAAGRNRLYDNGHQLVMPVIGLDGTGVSYLSCYASAVYLDAYQTDPEDIRATAARMKSERVPFQNLWALSHSVWGNDVSLNYEKGTLYVSGEAVTMTFEPTPYDEDYDYQRDIVARITISIQRQNKVLLAVTVIVAVLFALLMIHLRRLNRRSFFY